jgi:AraC-like DNA-binding protein
VISGTAGDYNSTHLKSTTGESARFQNSVAETGYLLSQEALTKKYLASQSDIDYSEIQILLEDLSQIVGVKDFIHSIYLVCPKNNMVITSNGIFAWDTFYDKTWLNDLDTASAITWKSEHSIITDRLSNHKVQVVTAVFSLEKYYPGKDGYIAMNISESSLQKKLKITDGSSNHFIILDQYNRTIAASDAGTANLLSQKQYQSVAWKNGKNTWLRINGKIYLSAMHDDIGTNWKYLVVTPIWDARRTLFISFIYVIFALLIAAIASVLLSFHLRNTAYTPIASLMQLSDSKREISESGIAQFVEFQNISRHFNRILLEKHHMEDKVKIILPELKEHFFQKLIAGQLIPATEINWQKDMFSLGSLESASYAVVYIKLEHSSGADANDPENTWLSSLVIKEYVSAVSVPGLTLQCCLETELNLLCCIFSCTKETNINALIGHFIEELLACDKNKTPMVFGVGTPVKDIEDLQKTSRQAYDALQLSAVYGNEQVVFYKAINTSADHLYLNPLPFVKLLVSAIKTIGHEAINNILDQIDQALYEGHYDLPMIRLFYLSVINFIVVNEQDITDAGLNDRLKALTDSIYRADTLPQVHTEAFSYLEQLSETYMQIGKEWRRDLVNSICDYIKDNYMSDISLDIVADTFHFSSVYINRILKKYKGTTFYDLLTDYRLRQARSLLEDTDLPIYQVAARVGYANVQSFIRMFKGSLSMTPGKYRSACRKP